MFIATLCSCQNRAAQCPHTHPKETKKTPQIERTWGSTDMVKRKKVFTSNFLSITHQLTQHEQCPHGTKV